MTVKYEFNTRNMYQISQRHLIKLFDLFEVTNMDNLKRILDSDKLIAKSIEQAKQVKLKNELLVQQIRLTKLRADYFASFGREISDSSFKTMTGTNNSKYTQEQWDLIFSVLVEVRGNVLEPQFQCVVCHRVEPTRPIMATHLQQYHEKEMRFAIQ